MLRIGVTLLIVVAALVAVSLLPVRQTESPRFASPAFQRAFNVDSSAASRAVELWGGDPLLWRVEPYHGAPDDRRVVQYFERGRMETQTDSSVVTHGLLAKELMAGEIDLGGGASLDRQPPEISIDSMEIDDEVPTYLTLSQVIGAEAEDRSGSGDRVVDWVDRGGAYRRESTPTVVHYSDYVTETGHNLPDVTTELFGQSEFADGRWIDAFGYPISEPYWANFRRGEESLPSLIQVFERRILVYTPELPSEQRFTVASAGRHYYAWRYGSELTEPAPDAETDVDEADGITTLDGFTATTYARDIGTPIDMTLSPTGHPLILTQEGQVLRPLTRDPDGVPEEFGVWADGIDAPLGIATSGASVVVTAEEGVQWYREREGAGVLNETVDYRDDLSADQVPAGPPVFDQDSHLAGLIDGTREVLPLLGIESGHQVPDGRFTPSGPLAFAGSDLFLAGLNGDRRASVATVPVEEDEPASDDLTILTSFPPGTSAQALSVAGIDAWRAAEVGRVFLAVEGEDGARVYAIPDSRSPERSEAVEFVGGLDGPVATLFGLDGSLYIADADQGTVIRVSPTE